MAESSNKTIIVVMSAIPRSPGFLADLAFLVLETGESGWVFGIMLVLLDGPSLELVIEVQASNAHDSFQVVPEISSALAIGIFRPRIEDYVGVTNIGQLRVRGIFLARADRDGIRTGIEDVIKNLHVFDHFSD